jgi:hypothetical protein
VSNGAGPGDGPEDGPEDMGDVGSVGDEAAKLFGALSDWARDHGSDLGHGLSGVADQASAAARDVRDHLDTGAAECAYCPICRTVHLVRQASPEVREQLTVAAASLMQAAAGLLATAARAGQPARPTGVERIDLDEGQDDLGGWLEDEQ